MQDSISVRTPAKINLSLDILGKRNDGYHFVKTIMQAVSIFDEITIEPNENGEIRIFCDRDDIPSDESNLAHKAAVAFFKHIKLETTGIDITIEKKIPALAGLAGGSSNAAGVIVGLNELMGTELSVDELCDIGARVGADVPFCIIGGTAIAEGVGDILNSLPNIPECYFVIVKPDFDISTAEAFARYDLFDVPKSSEFDDMIAAIALQDIEKIGNLLFNALECAADHTEISRIKEEMIENGAIGALMTGSGSAVYGIFEKKRQAAKCAEEFSEKYDFVEVCTPFDNGAEII